jgi:hypothetical protein
MGGWMIELWWPVALFWLMNAVYPISKTRFGYIMGYMA